MLNLLPEMRKEGIQPHTVSCTPTPSAEKIKMLLQFGQFDIIYLQKKLLPPLDVKLYRWCARKLVFDFDDAIYYRDDKQALLESRTRNLKFQSLVKSVDLVGRESNSSLIMLPDSIKT